MTEMTIIKTKYYCIHCGKQDIWLDKEEKYGDYYHELSGSCLSCDGGICCISYPEAKDILEEKVVDAKVFRGW